MTDLGLVAKCLLSALPSAIFLVASPQSLLSQVRNDVGRGRAPVVVLDSDRIKDGLRGPVRRVRTEVTKAAGDRDFAREWGPRSLLEETVYGVDGHRVENETYPVVSGVLGQESYEYDSEGHLLAAVVRNNRGQILSRTFYAYEFDSKGNWVMMTSFLADGAPGRERLKTAEVTHRVITYYTGDETADAGGSSNRTEAAEASGVGVSVEADGVSDFGVINDRASALPRPAYPVGSVARRTPLVVSVEVVVDKAGRVISARATGGPAELRVVAEGAARRAGFSPFLVAGQPVKAKGLLNYSFPFDP